jgi:hypothetical protein
MASEAVFVQRSANIACAFHGCGACDGLGELRSADRDPRGEAEKLLDQYFALLEQASLNKGNRLDRGS